MVSIGLWGCIDTCLLLSVLHSFVLVFLSFSRLFPPNQLFSRCVSVQNNTVNVSIKTLTYNHAIMLLISKYSAHYVSLVCLHVNSSIKLK